jgi:serine/threonine-protein kinase
MVARRAAFERPTAVQTMSAIFAEEPRRVADLTPRVPERVQEIIERGLAKDPDARYASTLDLAREVRGVARHERDGGRGRRSLRRTKCAPAD